MIALSMQCQLSGLNHVKDNLQQDCKRVVPVLSSALFSLKAALLETRHTQKKLRNAAIQLLSYLCRVVHKMSLTGSSAALLL